VSFEVRKMEPDLETDILFVGAGSAALCFWIEAFRSKEAQELLKRYKITMVDKNDHFGGGEASAYGINSFTSANSFLKLMYDQSKAKEVNPQFSRAGTNLHSEAASVIDSEIDTQQNFFNFGPKRKNRGEAEDEEFLDTRHPLPFLKELNDSILLEQLRACGKSEVPMNLAGHFQKLIGSYLLRQMEVIQPGGDYFQGKTDVQTIQLRNDGSALVRYRDPVSTATKRNADVPKLSEKFKYKTIKAKTVVLAYGGVSDLSPQFARHYEVSPSKVFLASDVMAAHGYNRLIEHLSVKDTRRVVLVGELKISLAIAKLLATGPVQAKKSYEFVPRNTRPNTTLKKISLRKDPGQGTQGDVKDNTHSSKGQREGVAIIENGSETNSSSTAMDRFKIKRDPIDFGEGSILIVHKNRVKLYYPSIEDAEEDDYRYEDEEIGFDGKLNKHTGLKGAHKELFLSSIRRQERRVKMVKLDKMSDLKQLIQSCDAVVVTNNLEPPNIDIRGPSGKPLNLASLSTNHKRIDGSCHLITNDKGSVLRLFGSGMGFAYPANETSPGDTHPESTLQRIKIQDNFSALFEMGRRLRRCFLRQLDLSNPSIFESELNRLTGEAFKTGQRLKKANRYYGEKFVSENIRMEPFESLNRQESRYSKGGETIDTRSSNRSLMQRTERPFHSQISTPHSETRLVPWGSGGALGGGGGMRSSVEIPQNPEFAEEDRYWYSAGGIDLAEIKTPQIGMAKSGVRNKHYDLLKTDHYMGKNRVKAKSTRNSVMGRKGIVSSAGATIIRDSSPDFGSTRSSEGGRGILKFGYKNDHGGTYSKFKPIFANTRKL